MKTVRQTLKWGLDRYRIMEENNAKLQLKKWAPLGAHMLSKKQLKK
jgi:hypothetical protein